MLRQGDVVLHGELAPNPEVQPRQIKVAKQLGELA